MAVQVTPDSPLAEALNGAIQSKLMEVGLAQTADAPALSEYILLMLSSGKSQDEIVYELCTELLNLPPGDANATQFVAWMFEHAQQLSGQNANAEQPPSGPSDAMPDMNDAANGEMDTDMGTGPAELNAPTGPRSMRNGSNPRGGREKRMLGQIGKAMDRTNDPLHRTRGNDRINSHSRGPPSGPRGGRGGRGGMNARATNIQAGINAMGGLNGRNGPMGGPMNGAAWMPGQQPPSDMDLFSMMKQQQEMMAQMQQQLMGGGQNGFGQQRQGKSLFERSQHPQRGNRGNRHHQNHNNNRAESSAGAGAGAGSNTGEGAAEGEDVEMSKREPPNPEDTICKYNLRCTNRECKFAHQSPAAPAGAHVDTKDICSFGAACKNRKCVGRHPSPATKLAHQGEQDCKFFPNCHNPQCPFKHPEMPLCRNGAGCTTAGCKFTHVKVKCRFNPCKNPNCAYSHDEGQQGVFKDKVWTAEGDEHVSERKFVEDGAQEEVILTQTAEDDIMGQQEAQAQELIT